MDKTEKELREKIFRLEAIINHLPFDVWYKNLNGEYEIVNKHFADMAGMLEEDIIGKKDCDIYNPEEAKAFVESDKKVIAGQEEGYFNRVFSGGKHWEEYKRQVYDDEGNLIGTAGTSRDMTDIHRTYHALEVEEKRFYTIFEKAPMGIAVFDIDTGRPIQVNDKYLSIIGRTKAQMEAESWEAYSHPDELEENRTLLKRQRAGEIDSFELEKRFLRPDGQIVWVNMITSPFKLDDSRFLQICMLEDITERKASEKEIVFLSYCDQLTGMFNRRFFEKELARLDKERHLPLTIIMADVNGLKMTNDAFGHSQGDAMLKRLAEVLKRISRSTDVVARLGGDEFVMVLPRTSYEDAGKVVSRVCEAIKAEQSDKYIFSVSFGWATKEEPEEDIDKVVVTAEYNMYGQKLAQSVQIKEEILKKITKTLHRKNSREQQHCERVSMLCQKMAQVLGMGEDAANDMKLAGVLHDIGKIGIDEKLLNKTGALSDREWGEMIRHPEISYQLLRSVNEFAPLARFVLHHHERMDGKGYPGHLKGDEIPLQAKIISIADSYDAMTSQRTYKPVLSEEEAILELRRSAGTQFDGTLVEIFITGVLPEIQEGKSKG